MRILLCLSVAVIVGIAPTLVRPAAAQSSSFDGKWEMRAKGTCHMKGELSVDGETVKIALADTTRSYVLAGTLDKAGNLKASPVGGNMYRLEGPFPQALVGHGTSNATGNMCNGAYFDVTRVK